MGRDQIQGHKFGSRPTVDLRAAFVTSGNGVKVCNVANYPDDMLVSGADGTYRGLAIGHSQPLNAAKYMQEYSYWIACNSFDNKRLMI